MASRSTQKPTHQKRSGKSAASTRPSTRPVPVIETDWPETTVHPGALRWFVAAFCAAVAAFAALAFLTVRASAETVSWYGPGFHGRLTANGERYDQEALTCAHRTLPFGTVLALRHGQRAATCRVNDRGPFVAGRELDVSRAVAARLGMIGKGVAHVDIRRLAP